MNDRGFFWLTIALLIGCVVCIGWGGYLMVTYPNSDYMLIGAALVACGAFNLARMAPGIYEEWFR